MTKLILVVIQPYSSLSTPEKDERASSLLSARKEKTKLYIDHLKQKIMAATDSDGLVVDDELHEDLKNMAVEFTRVEPRRLLFWDP